MEQVLSLGLLAGGIAHDFNNLLTGIIGNASLAFAEVPADAPVKMYLRGIVQAGERAAFLTRQMLAYAGRGHFVTETIDLGDLVREISALVRTSVPGTVELKLDFAPDLPPIEADPAQMQQVIMNLVINGAEAIGENATGKVEIRTRLCEIDAREAAKMFPPEKSAAGVYVQLEVSDTGSGMDEATKAHIFDPFFTTKFNGPRVRPRGSSGNYQRTRRSHPRLQHAGARNNICDSASRPAPQSRGRPPGTAPGSSHSIRIDRARDHDEHHDWIGIRRGLCSRCGKTFTFGAC